MGFRSYVRQFWGAILMLLRPSLPWCFPIRQLSFAQKQQQQQQQQQEDEKVAKIIIAIWVSEVTLGSFGVQFLMLLRPSLPWCFPIRQLSFEQKEQQQQQQQ